MFIFHITKKSLRIAGLVLLAVILLVLFLFFANKNLQSSDNDWLLAGYPDGTTPAQQQTFLRGYGWEVDPAPLAVRDIVIPSEFDDVYEEYNQIQRTQGFDLCEFKEETVSLITYNVINYQGAATQVTASLLVCRGKIIGGDISSSDAENGFTLGFKLEG